MEISGRIKEQSTVVMAIVTLAMIGCTLMASTWQNMLNQRRIEEQHLEVISRSSLLAIEATLRNGPIRTGANLSPRTLELFSALEEDGVILFAGILDHMGGKVLTSSFNKHEDILLPDEALHALLYEGQWSGKLQVEGVAAYVSGKLLAPVRGQILTLHESPQAPVFLVVGIDTDVYLSLHAGFRKNIVLQALYILLAALGCWIFAFRFLARRDQAKRAEALERFQDILLDNLPDGLLTIGKDKKILSANPVAVRLLGEDKKNLVGQRLADMPAPVSACIKEGCLSKPGVWESILWDGRHLEIVAIPLPRDKNNAFLVLVRDRTRLRTLEQSLAEAEKLAMLGTLAAGVAHEVRNPLSSLRGFAQYFLKKLKGQQPEEEYARTMVTEADRLNRVITDLLFLAKPKRILAKQTNLEAMAHEIKMLLRFDLEQKVAEITLQLDEKSVFADEDALKQSLLNLLLNSLDALPSSGGLITLSSGRAALGTWVTVRDNGCGMTTELATKAFDPFFTAKARGTGLGLALVNRIMADHGGTATIESEPGKGCAITLFFPDEPVGMAAKSTTDQ